MDRQTDGQTDRWSDGQMDGGWDGWMGGIAIISEYLQFPTKKN